MMNQSQANRLLGYPADARLLIINADDFGMCHSINEAVFRAFQEGVLCSTTLMVPCPWAMHAMHFLTDHPDMPFGIHLTVISDWDDYRWGPVTSREKVPSLLDRDGYFRKFDQMSELFENVQLDQLEVEFRSQIEKVLDAGLHPNHLDWHSLRLKGQDAIFDLMLRLAKDYGLALRVAGQPWIARIQSSGLPVNDHVFLDSYLLDPATKSTQYIQLLRELPDGLSEWAVHPGLDGPELLAIERSDNHIRQADFDFLTSVEAKRVIEEEGIILLNYRALQAVWNDVLQL